MAIAREEISSHLERCLSSLLPCSQLPTPPAPQMSNLTLAQNVILAENVLIQDLAGESVLLNLESEEYFGLDEVGTRILTVVNESESLKIAYEILLAEYDVEGIQLEQDLLEFIEQLVKHGLVQVRDS